MSEENASVVEEVQTGEKEEGAPKTDKKAEKTAKAEEKAAAKAARAEEKADKKRIAELEGLIAKMTEKGDELLASLQRERADFENYKRRNAAATSDAYANGSADAILATLPVLDNFERALTGADESDPFIKGMIMVYRQFLDVLKGLGLSEIEALDKPFDPNVHNAVMTEPRGEREADMVCEVLSKGYMFKDRVLRHSMVKVTEN